jgi:hypothetical protein
MADQHSYKHFLGWPHKYFPGENQYKKYYKHQKYYTKYNKHDVLAKSGILL